MRDDGTRVAQTMQFAEGDILQFDVTCPPNVDPHAAPTDAATNTENAAQPPQPPTDAELKEAFARFVKGRKKTLSKKNPGMSDDALTAQLQGTWDELSSKERLVFVMRNRAAANATATPAAERVLHAGTPVPRLLWGRHKGAEYILRERALYPAAGLRGLCQTANAHTDDNRCCCTRLLSSQADFSSECSMLQHLVEERQARSTTTGLQYTTARHLCLFLPKFHCELNWIERFWGASKAYCRKHCLYTLPGLRETVPLSLSQDIWEIPASMIDEHGQVPDDMPVAPLLLQRRWARISRRYMDEYRKGADGSDAIRAVKAQRRHRDPNDDRSRAVEAAMASMF